MYINERDKIIALVRKDAERRRKDTTISNLTGVLNDNGALCDLYSIDIFLAGWDHKLPMGWGKFAKQAKKQIEKENDPEWLKYQKLKKKFDD